MKAVRVAQTIKDHQAEWSRRAECKVDFQGYCLSAEANLPWVSERTREEFSKADGNEFGNGRSRGKIFALHSSSALTVNVFDYWRSRDLAIVSHALGSTVPATDLHFEQKFPTGVRPRSPNMDVVIDLKDGSILAIESKFTESFGGRKKTIREAYFDSDRWSRRGLPGAQSVANDVRRGRSFGTVDAPQLLKHTLGLASQNRTWSLLLLWYAPDSETAARMAGDAEDFKSALGPDGSRLRVMTYQELWPRIVSGCGAVDAAYVAYISSRYFVETQTEVFRIS